jgi:hypothetical protein
VDRSLDQQDAYGCKGPFSATPTIAIRSEVHGDEDATSEATIAAFSSLPVSHHTEQFAFKALRADHALARYRSLRKSRAV